MTTYGGTINDPMGMLAGLDRRLTNLEQTETSPSAAPTNVVIGGSGQQLPVVLSQNITPVSGVTITPGAFYDSIYADIMWQPAADNSAVAYDVSWAQDNGDGTYSNANSSRVGGNSYRIIGLTPNTKYVVAIYAVNILGIAARYPPAAGVYLSFTSTVDSTIPPAVTNVVLAQGATTVIVTFTPLTVQQAPDVANGHGLYQVDISTDPTFATVSRSVRTSAFVVSFSDIIASATWYARVAPIDSSGNQGPFALSGSAVIGGVIDSMLVGNFSAARITFGTMAGDRIQANTLDVNAIKSSTLTANTIAINGGALTAGNPPSTGLLLNSQGLRLYNGGGLQIVLDAPSGTATFYGALSGNTITGANITASTMSATDGTNSVSLSITNAGAGVFFSTISGAFYQGGIWANNGSGGHMVIQSPASGPYPYACVLDLISGTSAQTWAQFGVNTTLYAGAFTVWSSQLFKQDIQAHDFDLTKLDQLSVRKYHMAGGEDDTWNYGLVAEEAQELVPELVQASRNEGILSVSMNHLLAMLVAGYQEQHKRLSSLEARRGK